MTRATPQRRRIGSVDALAAALGALTTPPSAGNAWLDQLRAIENARQALLGDRENWAAGRPSIRVVITVEQIHDPSQTTPAASN